MGAPIPEPYLYTARIRSPRFMTQIALINADLPIYRFASPYRVMYNLDAK